MLHIAEPSFRLLLKGDAEIRCLDSANLRIIVDVVLVEDLLEPSRAFRCGERAWTFDRTDAYPSANSLLLAFDIIPEPRIVVTVAYFDPTFLTRPG